MSIQAKAYGNRKAETVNGEKVPNRVNLMMSMEEAELLANRDKNTVAEIIAAAKAAVNGDEE